MWGAVLLLLSANDGVQNDVGDLVELQVHRSYSNKYKRLSLGQSSLGLSPRRVGVGVWGGGG